MKTLIASLMALSTYGFESDQVTISYEEQVKPVFSRSCAQCHSGNTVLPNLLVYENAYKYRFQIREKMNDRSMPHVGILKESERDLIRNWVNQGARK